MDEKEKALSESINHLSNALEEYGYAKTNTNDFSEVKEQLIEAHKSLDKFDLESEDLWR